jgi:hypothetical protein
LTRFTDLFVLYVVADDYRAHTSCITEVERYEKRAPKKNGKVPPQQLWMELITNSIPTAPVHLQSYMRSMSTLDNVPRKEKPFYNFTANSLNLKNKHGSEIVSQIWKFLSDCRQNHMSTTKQSKDTGESTTEVPSVQKTDSLSILVTDSRVLGDNKEAIQLTKGREESNKHENVATKVDKKVVKKRMRQAFKRANSKSLTIKQLRKLVKQHFNNDELISVKQIIKDTIDRGKYFSREGDTITLLNK